MARPTPPLPPFFMAKGLRAGPLSPVFGFSLRQGGNLTLLGTHMPALSYVLDSIAGFQPVLGSTLHFAGQEIASLPPGRRGLGIVSPRDPLFPHMSVHANITFACLAQKQNPATAIASTARLLSLMGLDRVREQRPHDLTPEHVLRTTLARALAGAPSLLLLDDPLRPLDVPTAQKMGKMLLRLQKALGLTVIRTESRRETALHAGGSIALFKDRTLLQVAEASVLYEHPDSASVATLFGDANALTGQILNDDNDVLTIHLACGGVVEATRPLTRPDGPALTPGVGDTCCVCIRPDRISPFFGEQFRDDDDGLSPVRGILTGSLHLGDCIKLMIRCPDGTEIEIRRPPLQAQKIPKDGTPVELAWPAAHAAVFPLENDLY